MDPVVKQQKNLEEKAGLVDVKRFDGITDAKKAALLSLSKKQTGKVNKGVIGQYPYFAPDA